MKCQSSEKATFKEKEIPLINVSLALSEIESACHKCAILFSKSPHNPELDKQTSLLQNA